MFKIPKRFALVTLVFLSLSIPQRVNACGMQALELLIPLYIGAAVTAPVWGPFYAIYKAIKVTHQARIKGENDHLFRVQDSNLKKLDENEQRIMRDMKEFFYVIAQDHPDSPILWEGVPANLRHKWEKFPQYLALSKIEALWVKDKVKAAAWWRTAKPFFKAATSKAPQDLTSRELTKLRMINIQKQLIVSSKGDLQLYKNGVLDFQAVLMAVQNKEALTEEAEKIKNLLFADVTPSDELCAELNAYVNNVMLATVDLELSGAVIKKFKRTFHPNAGTDTQVAHQS